MDQSTVVGIDVGGKAKGFNAVSLLSGRLVNQTQNTDPERIADWCLAQGAGVVAIDAPCRWSQNGRSRLAERELVLFGSKIPCFATPARNLALQNKIGFYEWMFNGERLYQQLVKRYPLFRGTWEQRPICFETFPQAIMRSLEGQVSPKKTKLTRRYQVLTNRGYDVSNLSNIDFVDATLCAVAADEFQKNNFLRFGNAEEGFIIIPNISLG